METIEVSTTIQVPPARAYEFLRDFEGYSQYSKYLQSVTADGDGSEGTEYEIRFGWWKLSYGVSTLVTETIPPERLEWEVTTTLDAHGRWEVEPAGEEPTHSQVALVVTYDPDSADGSAIDLPPFVSLDWVVRKAIGLIEEEGRRVVGRVVADLEGEPRPVQLCVEHRGTAHGD